MMNLNFIYGIIVGCILVMGLAVLDIKLFKDKLINKKIQDYRVYLFYTGIEFVMFLMGYLVGIWGIK